MRAGLVHYQFEAIHPFLDGNGRIGRLLINLLLHEWQVLKQPFLNLSVYFETHRQEYYEHLLNISRKGMWEEWLLFFLKGISSQANQDARRIEQLVNLRSRYVETIKSKSRLSHLEAVLEGLVFQRPIFTVRQVENSLEIPYMSAERCIEILAGYGIVHEISRRKRNRIYRADEILKILVS